MEEAIFMSDGWMSKVVMAKFNSVGDKEGFCGGVGDSETSVVLQGGADVESVAGAEGPGGTGGWLVVYEYAASNGAKEGGVEVEGAIEVFPCGCEGGRWWTGKGG